MAGRRSSSRPRRNPAERRQERIERNGALEGDEAVDQAREAALRILDRCEQSSAQCRTKLRAQGYPAWAIDTAIARLVELGLIDDRRYATMLVRARRGERALTGRALTEQLRAKGIAPELIDEVVGPADPERDFELALGVARKKLRTGSALDYQVAKRRVLGALARKGYGGSLSYRAFAQAWEEARGGEDSDDETWN